MHMVAEAPSGKVCNAMPLPQFVPAGSAVALMVCESQPARPVPLTQQRVGTSTGPLCASRCPAVCPSAALQVPKTLTRRFVLDVSQPLFKQNGMLKWVGAQCQRHVMRPAAVACTAAQLGPSTSMMPDCSALPRPALCRWALDNVAHAETPSCTAGLAELKADKDWATKNAMSPTYDGELRYRRQGTSNAGLRVLRLVDMHQPWKQQDRHAAAIIADVHAGVTNYMQWPRSNSSTSAEASLYGSGKGVQVYDQTTRGGQLQRANTPKVGSKLTVRTGCARYAALGLTLTLPLLPESISMLNGLTPPMLALLATQAGAHIITIKTGLAYEFVLQNNRAGAFGGEYNSSDATTNNRAGSEQHPFHMHGYRQGCLRFRVP